MMVGLVGYSGHDLVLQILMAGVDAVTAQGSDVVADLSGDRLDLSTGSYHLIAVRIGPEPIPSTPSPTDTRS
jgi:hypothetical protein